MLHGKPIDGGPSFALRNRIVRLAWNLTWKITCSWTPRQFHPWRRLILRIFGARMARRSDVRGSARVWLPSNLVMESGALIGERVICYNMACISLEKNALVSQGAHLCAGNHNIDDPAFTLYARPIVLGAQSWVATDAFVAPGVTIGEGAVLGARAVGFQNLAPWTLYVGNPAIPRRPRTKAI